MRASRTAPINGGTVRLTIDQTLQYTVQQELDAAVASSGARGGQVAILTKTGQVLALASTGTFNSADPNSLNPNAPSDPPIQSVFEPGFGRQDHHVRGGGRQQPDHPEHRHRRADDAAGRRRHDPRRVVAPGGAVHRDRRAGRIVQRRHPRRSRRRSARRSGSSTPRPSAIGQATGIELPGESAGYIPPIGQWSESTFANLPFGQGEDMTVLQLASMYQAIANNGVRIPPRIVESVTEPERLDDGDQAAGRGAGRQPDDRADAADDARVGDPARRHRYQGGDSGLRGRRQDRNGAAARPGDRASTATRSTGTRSPGSCPADNPQFIVSIMIDNPSERRRGRRRGRARCSTTSPATSCSTPTSRRPASQAKHVPLQICDPGTLFYSPSTVC